MVIMRLVQLYVVSIIPEWSPVPAAINHMDYMYQGCPFQGKGAGTGGDLKLLCC